MQICKNCRQLFDPSITPGPNDVYAGEYLCSWHVGAAELVGSAGPRDDYADIYRWSCCGKSVPGAVIAGRDYPPRRAPGCNTGPHVPDPNLSLDPQLSAQLEALRDRLREVEAREATGPDSGGVFISYSHRDSHFVDLLTERLTQDDIAYWRDDKDLLVGEVIDQAISDGIQRNALFLIVLSPASIASNWVQRELDEASHEADDECGGDGDQRIGSGVAWIIALFAAAGSVGLSAVTMISGESGVPSAGTSAQTVTSRDSFALS